jgi:hypothetical protein
MAPEEPTPGGSYRIQSKATGFQLIVTGHDAPGWDEGRPHVELNRDRDGGLWEVTSADVGLRFGTNGTFPWGGAGTHLGVLDSNAERQVYILPPNDGSYQKWRPIPDGEGYWQLVNVATGFALDASEEDVYTMEPNDGAHQRWGFFRS